MTVTLNLSQFDLLWGFFWVAILRCKLSLNWHIQAFIIMKYFDIYSYLYKFCKNLTIIFSTKPQCWLVWMIFDLTQINHSYLNYISIQCICVTTDLVHVNLSKWAFSKNVSKTKCEICWKILNIFEHFEIHTARFART